MDGDFLSGVITLGVLVLMAVPFERLRDVAPIVIGVYLVLWPVTALGRYYLVRRGELL